MGFRQHFRDQDHPCLPVLNVCREVASLLCSVVSVTEAATLFHASFTLILMPPHPPLPGQPFNGQLVKEDGRQDEGAEERSQETQDAGAEVPETLATGSAQAFPGRQPERFASHHPDQPVPAAPQPPRRSRSHTWKQLGTTECSATCGKGERVQGSPLQRPR